MSANRSASARIPSEARALTLPFDSQIQFPCIYIFHDERNSKHDAMKNIGKLSELPPAKPVASERHRLKSTPSHERETLKGFVLLPAVQFIGWLAMTLTLRASRRRSHPYITTAKGSGFLCHTKLDTRRLAIQGVLLIHIKKLDRDPLQYRGFALMRFCRYLAISFLPNCGAIAFPGDLQFNQRKHSR